MKKILPVLLFVLLAGTAFSQGDKDGKSKKKQKIDMSNRPNDHFMVQFGLHGWNGAPDSLNITGFSKSFNAYFLFDFPFKTNPQISVAIGVGVGTDHIIFSNRHVGIKDLTTSFPFTNTSDTNHYKKTKLATAWLEAPLELRYAAHPMTGKGLKVALGLKIGTMINAHTRNSKFENKGGTSINSAVVKESSKRFFNKNRICFTGRIGLGHISLFSSYQLTSIIKEGAGPQVKPYTIGITLSGL